MVGYVGDNRPAVAARPLCFPLLLLPQGCCYDSSRSSLWGKWSFEENVNVKISSLWQVSCSWSLLKILLCFFANSEVSFSEWPDHPLCSFSSWGCYLFSCGSFRALYVLRTLAVIYCYDIFIFVIFLNSVYLFCYKFCLCSKICFYTSMQSNM